MRWKNWHRFWELPMYRLLFRYFGNRISSVRTFHISIWNRNSIDIFDITTYNPDAPFLKIGLFSLSKKKIEKSIVGKWKDGSYKIENLWSDRKIDFWRSIMIENRFLIGTTILFYIYRLLFRYFGNRISSVRIFHISIWNRNSIDIFDITTRWPFLKITCAPTTFCLTILIWRRLEKLLVGNAENVEKKFLVLQRKVWSKL